MILSKLRKLTAAAALVLAGFITIAPAAAVAQEAAAPAAATAPAAGHDGKAGEAKHHEKTLLDIFIEGGWVMYPIAACSILLVWLVVDGFIKTAGKRVYPEAHVTQLRESFRAGDYVTAYTFSKTHPSAFCDIVRAGVAYSPDGKTMTEEAILSELDRVKANFDARISYLSVIGVCTPMIGLVGTVTGMMKAFEKLGTSGAGDPSALSGAIGEVLVATASGLFIAIPAFICYYLLRNRVTKCMHDLQELAASLFRNMPYDDLAGTHIGDEEIYAAKPAWIAAGTEAETPAA